MDLVSGQTLIRADGSKLSAQDALGGKSIILFYFSAHWCPPCRGFTPLLKDFYEEVVDDGQLEIVFVSSDRSSEAMLDYMKESHGKWLALEYGSGAINDLKSKFNIRGIPTLIVCRKDGSVITTNGRGDVESVGPGAVRGWK